MTRKEAAAYLGITEATLAQMATRGSGPRFSKLNDRMVRYRQADIDEWIASHLMDDTRTPVTSGGRRRAS